LRAQFSLIDHCLAVFGQSHHFGFLLSLSFCRWFPPLAATRAFLDDVLLAYQPAFGVHARREDDRGVMPSQIGSDETRLIAGFACPLLFDTPPSAVPFGSAHDKSIWLANPFLFPIGFAFPAGASR
jgi:hypothetical protein